MKINLNGIEYEFIIGSDIDRDVMFLEASNAESSEQAIAEIFYSDKNHDFSINCFYENVPLELLEAMINIAKERLPTNHE